LSHDFNALCGPLRPSLLSKALRLTNGDRPAAEDFVQETYTTAWGQWSTFEPERGSPSAWLHRIMLNRFRDNYRRLSRERAFYEDADEDEIISGSMASEPFGPTDAMLGRGYLELGDDEIRRALLAMPRSYREIIERTVEGQDDDAVASDLGIDPKTARSRLSKARRLIKQILAGERADLLAA
jgi:RNA polymerase sigma-70 factor (ECF subfamily)